MTLQELVRLHDDIEEAMAVLERLTAEATPRLGEVSGARYRLTRASRARTTLLNDGLYMMAAMRATPAQQAAIEALRVEAARLLTCSVRHIGHWTVTEIAARWTDYCAASRKMRADMRRRIAAERALLYPLLGADPEMAAA